jgi:hypothetical protein
VLHPNDNNVNQSKVQATGHKYDKFYISFESAFTVHEISSSKVTLGSVTYKKKERDIIIESKTLRSTTVN